MAEDMYGTEDRPRTRHLITRVSIFIRRDISDYLSFLSDVFPSGANVTIVRQSASRVPRYLLADTMSQLLYWGIV